jgi:hypothetical protein
VRDQTDASEPDTAGSTARCFAGGSSNTVAAYGTFPRTAQADAVSDRGPSGEPEQYASRTAALIRAFRAGARLAK